MNAWSCADRERFLVRSWSAEQSVVFDMLSGDTHLLEPLALELLRRLDAGVARSARALLEDLADGVEDTPAEAALAAVEHSLASMWRVGLVIASPA